MNPKDFDRKLKSLRELDQVKDMVSMLQYGGFDKEGIERVLHSLVDLYDEKKKTLQLNDFQQFAEILMPALVGGDSPIQDWMDNMNILDRPEFADLWFDTETIFDLKEDILALERQITDDLGEGMMADIIMSDVEPQYSVTLGKILEKALPTLVTGEVIDSLYRRVHSLYGKTDDAAFKQLLGSILQSFNVMDGQDNPYPIYLMIKSLLRDLPWVENYIVTQKIEDEEEKAVIRTEFEDGLYVALADIQDGGILYEEGDEFENDDEFEDDDEFDDDAFDDEFDEDEELEDDDDGAAKDVKRNNGSNLKKPGGSRKK